MLEARDKTDSPRMNRRIKSASNLSELAAQEAEEASSSRSVRFQLNGSSLAVAIDDDSSEDDDDEGGEGMLQESASWNPPPSSTQEIADSHFDLSSSFFKRRQGFGRNAETNWVERWFTLYGSVLCYYDSPVMQMTDFSRPRGRLDLIMEFTTVQVKRKKKVGAPTDLLLIINIHVLGTAKRKWELSCQTVEQQTQWYNALKQFDGRPLDHHHHDHNNVANSILSSPGRSSPSTTSKTTGDSSPIIPTSPKQHLKSILLTPSSTETDPLLQPNTDVVEQTNYHQEELPLSGNDNINVKGKLYLSCGLVNLAVVIIRVGNIELFWSIWLLLNLGLLYILTEWTHHGEVFKSLLGMKKTSTTSTSPKPMISSASRKRQTRPIISPQNSPSSSVSPSLTAPPPLMEKMPAGSTFTRAPALKETSLARMIEEHGPYSVQAAREYATCSKVDYEHDTRHSYSNTDASEFKLRVGPNYKKHRSKEPSSPALYDLLTMDFVQGSAGLTNASDAFEIPDVPGLTDIDTGNPHVPAMLVINASLPADEPSLFGPSTTDGPSYILVMYFVLAKHTLEQLKDLEHASPAVRLLVEWCRRSGTDDTFRGRFKCMGVVEDIEKTKIPSFIQGYNGKPALVQKSGKYRRYGNYAETWVNVHMWSFACKKGLAALRPKFPDFVLNTGFTIEARDDEELPEVLLAGVRVIHLDPTQARVIPTTTVEGEKCLPSPTQLRERADTY